MKMTDLKDKLLKRVFRGGEGDRSRRPDGGTSCYRPIRRKTQAELREQEEPQQPQSMTYIHTGFTGMNPPSGGADAYGQTAYGQPPYNQAAYDPQPYGQTAYGQDPWGRSGMYGQAWSQPGPQNPQTGFMQPAQDAPAAAARPERGWFPPREDAAARNNISYMPGYAPDAGAATFNHVEHIMTLTGLKSCYEAIECMKNGETLIVSLDAIANESESMRCQDMLAGAAFTLGCSVRTLQGARLVLIAPDGVKILPEESLQQPAAPVMPGYVPVQPSMQAPVQPAPMQEPARPRERRSGRNAADWNAAVNGQMDGYNPYTGTMPAAAGAYGSFGGYGY